MIRRYTPEDFHLLWSSERRFQTWLEVELAACRAMERAGRVPAGTADQVAKVRDRIDPSRIDAIEATTRHDVIAFLTHVEELAGSPARFLHLGMTSSDVLDSSLAMLMRDAAVALLARTDALLDAVAKRVVEHRRTPMIGRSHGIHAEPTTFGVVLAGHMAELVRGRDRLERARVTIATGKIAGAVGTYAHLTPEIEREALDSLGLRPETAATQVVARDRHASYLSELALMAAAIERLAINIRHWQRTEVGEAEEAFGRGQKGSSAMPHKRNPVLSENLAGLARIVRGAAATSFENIGLWHERDISHSSVERMIVPDATATLAFMLDRARGLIENLVVYPERMLENLERSGGLWASEGVMLALVQKGVARQQAYVMVQRNAMRAFHGEGDFATFLCSDGEIEKHLSNEQIRQHFSLDHALTHCDAVIDRVLAAASDQRGAPADDART